MKHCDAMRLLDHVAATGLADPRLTFEKVPNPRGKKPFDWDYDYGVDALDPDTGERVAFGSRADFLARYPAPAAPADQRRALAIIARVSADEKARVQQLADAAGQSVSDYIRSRIGL